MPAVTQLERDRAALGNVDKKHQDSPQGRIPRSLRKMGVPIRLNVNVDGPDVELLATAVERALVLMNKARAKATNGGNNGGSNGGRSKETEHDYPAQMSEQVNDGFESDAEVDKLIDEMHGGAGSFIDERRTEQFAEGEELSDEEIDRWVDQNLVN